MIAPLDWGGYRADDVTRCARCGCTDDAACPGGCWWVESDTGEDLCSRCVPGYGGTD